MNHKLILISHTKKGRMLDVRRTPGKYSFEIEQAFDELLAHPDVEFVRVHRVVEPPTAEIEAEDIPPAPFESDMSDDVPF